jgi:hypothetical protein
VSEPVRSAPALTCHRTVRDAPAVALPVGAHSQWALRDQMPGQHTRQRSMGDDARAITIVRP